MTDIAVLLYGYPGMYGFGRYGMYFDPTYVLILIGVVLSLIASAKVKSTYAKYQRVESRSHMTGAKTADRLLKANGIYDVRIEHVSGNLTDHYDPSKKVLRLSDSVYGNSSVAAVSVAAHEVGHCIQHSKNYAPLTIRSKLVPIANFGSQASWLFIIAGLIFGSASWLIDFGIILFSLAVLFQIVTLPVEFNASRRALETLSDNGILYTEEVGMGRKVLRAAALTYVASAATAILQLLRIVLLFGNRNRD